MTEYELFYLIAESKEVDTDRIKAEVKVIVEVEGGAFLGEDKVEKRKLAYAIKREVRGTYIAQRFTTPDKNDREASVEAGEMSIIGKINHKLNLYRDVLRFIIVTAKGLPPLKEEEGAASVVAEVVKEEKAKVLVEKKPARKAVKEVVTNEVSKEEKLVKNEKKSEAPEVDLDKQLEEVLHI
jgi:ribosomal protein S6